MLTYFAVHDLGLSFEQALFEEAASRLMLLMNQHTLVNVGEEKMMTLEDMELINGRRKRTTQNRGYP